MLPNNEEYDLSKENGHPRAQAILTDEFFWDCADDEAPLGNDNGADVFAFYGEALEAGEAPTALEFLEGVMEEWGFDFSDWNAAGDQAPELYENDRYSFEAANDSAIAFAFGMLVISGEASSEATQLALKAIERELNPTILVKRWAKPESRRAKLLAMKEALG